VWGSETAACNGEGRVDQNDYAVWRASSCASAVGGANFTFAVPESASD
jgi:hypothetical protein